MDDFDNRLEALLATEFPGSQRLYRYPTDSSKVGGTLLWEGFEDKPHTERQRLIWNALRARLSVQDQQRITAIFGLTQREHDSILEDEDDEVAEDAPPTPQGKRFLNGNGTTHQRKGLVDNPKVEVSKIRLEELLRVAFEGGETELETATRPAKISGFLVWDGFQDERQLDRQRHLWRVLSEGLPAADQKRITVILTVTPDEMRSLREVE